MKDSGDFTKYLVLAAVVVGLGLIGWRALGTSRIPSAAFVVPTLSAEAEEGRIVFNENCAACHGLNARGTEKGPPLVHDYYNPGHHNDAAFFNAIARGVPAHHWAFGDMPAQRQVPPNKVAAVIRYVRELQVANGID